jgi:hypothetical protein
MVKVINFPAGKNKAVTICITECQDDGLSEEKKTDGLSQLRQDENERKRYQSASIA